MHLNRRKERLLIYEKEKELTVMIASAIVSIGDPNTDGSWRFISTSGGIELQKRVAGAWGAGTGAVARWEL